MLTFAGYDAPVSAEIIMTKLRLVIQEPEEKAGTPVAPGDGDGGGACAQQPIFDERFGMSLFGRTYYINLRIGAELRASERRAAEGQVRVSGLAFFYCVICSGAIMLFGTLSLLYLLKSGMGIDLSASPSLLHPLYDLLPR